MDREKITKGLEELSVFLFNEYRKAQAEEASIYYDRFLSVDNALDLLKAQELVKPKSKARHGENAQSLLAKKRDEFSAIASP